jgi:UDP-2,3-diacylglucosamine hydrolase
VKQLGTRQTAYFASDLHLSANTPRTLEAFEAWMASIANDNTLIYLIGDLFEVWCGDDYSDTTTERFCKTLQSARSSGATVFLMHGNRDFLIGEEYADQCGAELLPDPEFLNAGGLISLITHGDALCTDDKPYQKFRLESRDESWQQRFLGLPIEHRLAIAKQARAESKSHKANMALDIMDVNATAVTECLNGRWPDGTFVGKNDVIIHGHTHRCAVHLSGQQAQKCEQQKGKLQPGMRIVLPDWNFDTQSPERTKGGYLKLEADAEFELVAWTA